MVHKDQGHPKEWRLHFSKNFSHIFKTTTTQDHQKEEWHPYTGFDNISLKYAIHKDGKHHKIDFRPSEPQINFKE